MRKRFSFLQIDMTMYDRGRRRREGAAGRLAFSKGGAQVVPNFWTDFARQLYFVNIFRL